jgi:8-oxo-dGTP pyrophosphatase MutT (NUDIX family)
MVKIFSQDKTIYLIDDETPFKSGKRNILTAIHSSDEMRLSYDELINRSDLKNIYFFNKSEKKLISYFNSLFRIIEAAGGLVKNTEKEWLFIYRNGKWDLPKGKIEKGEKTKKAAKREVEEECGIRKLKIIKEIPSTYHTYFMEEKAILKRTHWFEMSCSDDSKLVPQIEEGITDVKWLSAKKLKKVYANTYESIKEVLKEIV